MTTIKRVYLGRIINPGDERCDNCRHFPASVILDKRGYRCDLDDTFEYTTVWHPPKDGVLPRNHANVLWCEKWEKWN